MNNYYSVLGLTEDASEEEIRRAYRSLAKKYHPDINKSHDAQTRFILINKAYEMLIDRQKRLAYDHKMEATADPFRRYAVWVQEQKARQEADARKRYQEFIRKREEVQNSRLYYPYMITLYLGAILLMSVSILVLVVCAFFIVQYHVFMFFFLLPFICGAAYVLKFTLVRYRKYKAFFV